MRGRASAVAAVGVRGPALGVAVAALAHGGPGITAIRAVRRHWFPALAGIGRPDHVSLTFDDGPDPAATPRFLDVLADRRITATFFLLGRMVARAPGLAAELVAAGHEVGVHGWAHRSTLLRTPWGVLAELSRSYDLIAGVTGAAPVFYRPPNGVLSSGSILAARRLGLTPVLWTAAGRDWTSAASPESVHAAIAADLAGGGTVLLHDSDCTSAPRAWRSALGALPLVLDECAARGLRVGPLRDHGGQFPRIARNDSRSDPTVAKTAVGS